jgi:hypothetical protein
MRKHKVPIAQTNTPIVPEALVFPSLLDVICAKLNLLRFNIFFIMFE